jgi:predicted nucleotidyltransferase component of viral defense system
VSTKLDSSLFADVADTIGLGNPAIVEKDYYVVQLLQLISGLELEYHKIVFSGGTALSKSDVDINRMSEDLDIKLVPNFKFRRKSSLNKMTERQKIIQSVENLIEKSWQFTVEESPIIFDNGTFVRFDIKYPQVYKIAPFLRPYIKLELIEYPLQTRAVFRDISSIYSQQLKNSAEIEKMRCCSVIETQAEKIVSLTRRVAREERGIDIGAIIRHIYDTCIIQKVVDIDLKQLAKLVQNVVDLDRHMAGEQHKEFFDDPYKEMLFALDSLENNGEYKERFEKYVSSVSYSNIPLSWWIAVSDFNSLAKRVIELKRVT